MIKRAIRPVNLFLAGYSYLRSAASVSTTAHGMPPAIGVELTNFCNLECPECLTGAGLMKRARGFMDTGLFEKLVSELGQYLYNINLYFQGEPFLHPELFSFIRKSRGINTVISTNGHFLSAEGCERIARSDLSKLIISLDGADQETYEAYRAGGDLRTVTEGIKNITEARKKNRSSLVIEIQVLVNKLNEAQIPDIRKLAAGFGIPVRLKSMQIISGKSFGRWLPLNGKLSRYHYADGEYRIKSSLPGMCARLWFNPVITWDGNVLPCCFDKDADHIMGDLNNESFRDIWNGSRYRLFRRMLRSDRSSIAICNNCTSGLKGVIY